MKTWLPNTDELAVMQRRQDRAAGLTTSFVMDGGLSYERFVGDVGERCAEVLLRETFPECRVVNANKARMNQSGHDLLITGARTALISVKALSHVEGCGWLQSTSPKSLQFDLVLHIDFGTMVIPKGRYAKHDIPVKPAPDIYVVPRAQVLRWIGDARYGMGKTRWIYCWKRRPGPKDDSAQIRELLLWKNRLDLIAEAIGTSARCLEWRSTTTVV
jgi:hypothetical protein